ncbi:MAG: tol-pal system protein YbgF [Paracoccaceae bacterium]
MRLLPLALACALALPLPAAAQDKQTLADIQAELAQLARQFDSLKSELVTTGAASNGAAGGSALQRLDSIESAMSRLTARTEEIELRLNRVVTDGTNRLGDLEFRLCELEDGCDPANIPETTTLGGSTGATTAATAAPPAKPSAPASSGGPELAVGEQADFDRAKGVLDQGDFRQAATLFDTFAQTYTGGPLTQEALFLKGEALRQSGDTANAGRAYVDAFSSNPNGPRAGAALLNLGQVLGQLGQVPDACVTLAEVGTRFPGSAEAAQAQTAMAGYQCQ